MWMPLHTTFQSLLTSSHGRTTQRDELKDLYSEHGGIPPKAFKIEETRLPRRMRYLFTLFHIAIYLLALLGLVSLGLHGFSSMGNIAETLSTASGFRSGGKCATISHEQYTPDVYRPETLAGGLNICDCGSSIREALSRNCTYDSLSAAWLPPYCRDEEVTAEFEKSGPGPDGSWSFYADKDGQIPLNKAQIATLADTAGSFWTSRDWHIAHCLFYWQKYARMKDTGIVMEERFDGVHHVKHCSSLIRNPTPTHYFLIEVPVRLNSTIETDR